MERYPIREELKDPERTIETKLHKSALCDTRWPERNWNAVESHFWEGIPFRPTDFQGVYLPREVGNNSWIVFAWFDFSLPLTVSQSVLFMAPPSALLPYTNFGQCCLINSLWLILMVKRFIGLWRVCSSHPTDLDPLILILMPAIRRLLAKLIWGGLKYFLYGLYYTLKALLTIVCFAVKFPKSFSERMPWRCL